MKTPKAGGKADAARAQLAALPIHEVDGRVEIMLVTSRDTGRWVLPKGWPMKRTPHRDAAAREAFEEAGLFGEISAEPLGHYGYDKRLRSGRAVACRVDVYLLLVEGQHQDWPEREQRTTRWFGPEEAATRVAEAGLAELFRTLPLADLARGARATARSP